jgi:hypothetical protein
MLHRFHFVSDSFGFLVLEQPQMQIGSDIDLKGKGIVRIDPYQLRGSGAEALTRFG